MAREVDADACDAPCDSGASCCIERFVHGNGASVGWIRRGSPMFTVEEPEDASAMLANLQRWICEQPRRAGLSAAMADTGPLAGLAVASGPPRRHRSLVLHRFTQVYRGVPVVGAGELVTVTVAPGYGAIGVSGAIVDARDTYDGWDAAISAQAVKAAAAELLALEGGEVEAVPFTFGEPRLVAVAEVRALAWELEVARFGHSRGTLLLRASDGAMLAFSPAAHFGPEDEVAVKIRARTFASDHFKSKDPDLQVVADIDQHPLTGDPLLGSTYTPLVCDEDPDALPGCGQTRLGNRHIVVLDGDHQNFIGDKTSHPYIGVSASGEFLANPPVNPDEDSPMRRDAALQDYFYRLQATYSLIDGYNAGKWEPHRLGTSDFPVLEYKPRVVLVTNTDVLETCGVSQPGCAKMYWPFRVVEETNARVYDEHPEGDLPAHVWQPGDIHDEGMGFMGMGVDGFTSPDLVFHEFGHIVDLFMAPGLIGQGVSGSGCTVVENKLTCVAACVPDSTDEALALSETVADMFDMLSVGQLYTTVPYALCDAIGITTGMSGPVHDPACMADPGDIKSFLDQRPDEPGMVEHDGLWIPTGICNHAPGYRQSAVLQAWWEWTHGRSCSTTAPFTCDGFMGEAIGARSGVEALLFAVSQTNETYYKKLFTDMELYLACTDGPAQAARFREVFCHHGALDCAGPPPACPAMCGNGDAELSEQCDADDLRGQDCFDRGFVGGILTCRGDCTYDTSLCTDTAATTSGPSPTGTTADVPTMGWDPSAPSSSETVDGEDSAAEQAMDGCGCRHGANSIAGWLALTLLARRRRRRVDTAVSGGVR